MIETAWAEQFAQDWAAAWNAHDIEAVLKHFAEDCVFTSPVALRVIGDGVVHGKPALRAYWIAALKQVPDLHFEILGVHVGIATVVIHYRNQKGGEVCEVLTLDAERRVIEGHGTYRG